jgi:ectoine hydroxylase-related dioxygenase (phytanoyl-CoA dioxygenase family)
MKLSEQQINFFNTFGFLHVKGAMKQEIDWITSEFEAVHRGANNVHDGSKRTTVVPFIDGSEKLCTLLEHPILEGVAESILGPDFNYLAGDGNYYSGDTAWHSDGWWDTRVRFIKIAFYLDPLTYGAGALRVIPGSHVVADSFGQAAQQVCNSHDKFGIHGRDIPAVALDTQPGDLAIFNHNTKHASFGGNGHRRMFTLNLGSRCETPEQLELLKQYLGMHIPTWGPRTHSELMRSTANARRMRHLQQVIENEAIVAELHRKKQPVAV